jgi:hypothetical protein
VDETNRTSSQQQDKEEKGNDNTPSDSEDDDEVELCVLKFIPAVPDLDQENYDTTLPWSTSNLVEGIPTSERDITKEWN